MLSQYSCPNWPNAHKISLFRGLGLTLRNGIARIEPPILLTSPRCVLSQRLYWSYTRRPSSREHLRVKGLRSSEPREALSPTVDALSHRGILDKASRKFAQEEVTISCGSIAANAGRNARGLKHRNSPYGEYPKLPNVARFRPSVCHA